VKKLLLVLMLLGPMAASAQAPKTVLDYTCLLPARFNHEMDARPTAATRRSYLLQHATVDIPNGYIHRVSDGEPSFISALFKKTGGGYVLGVSENERVVFSPCLVFYEYRDGKLVDVTSTVLPDGYDPQLNYTLPRHGTTITVTDQKGQIAAKLLWTGRIFHAQ
jgi:hypothetical protein